MSRMKDYYADVMDEAEKRLDVHYPKQFVRAHECLRVIAQDVKRIAASRDAVGSGDMFLESLAVSIERMLLDLDHAEALFLDALGPIPPVEPGLIEEGPALCPVTPACRHRPDEHTEACEPCWNPMPCMDHYQGLTCGLCGAPAGNTDTCVGCALKMQARGNRVGA